MTIVLRILLAAVAFGSLWSASLPAVAATSSRSAAAHPGRCGPRAYSFPASLYPFHDRCLDLGYGDYHYFDERPRGRAKGTVLMVHGNPTSSFLYRDVARGLLRRGFRVIAVDHYGFGESAKPSPTRFGYRPIDHARVLTRFVDALDLRHLTLVVQDWGGPIGLGMAVRRPSRIKNLLVMNTWAWPITPQDHGGRFGALADWGIFAEQNQALLTASGFVISGAAAGLVSPYSGAIADKVRGAYLGPFFEPSSGALRSPQSAVPTVTFARSIMRDHAIFRRLGHLGPLAHKPLSLYFGAQDPLFGLLRPRPDGSCASGVPQAGQCQDARGKAIDPFVDRFRSLWAPSAVRHAEVAQANHFIQQDDPARVSELVVELNQPHRRR